MVDLPFLYHLGGIILAAGLVLGVLSDRPRLDLWREVYRAGAWSGVVGGGVYGLIIFDGGLLPVWSWESLLTVGGGTLAFVIGLRALHEPVGDR
jgi:hypothetical protein